MAFSSDSQRKIVNGDAGYVLEDVPHLTDFILDLPTYPNPLRSNPAYSVVKQYFVHVDDSVPQKVVVHKDSPRGTHFRRAGPRQKVYFKSDEVHACIVTCGGLCPGLNTVIREIVCGLYHMYGVTKILGIDGGYSGFYSRNTVTLTPKVVNDIHKRGGTILGTSRGGHDTVKIVDSIQDRGINQVYIIAPPNHFHSSYYSSGPLPPPPTNNNYVFATPTPTPTTTTSSSSTSYPNPSPPVSQPQYNFAPYGAFNPPNMGRYSYNYHQPYNYANQAHAGWWAPPPIRPPVGPPLPRPPPFVEHQNAKKVRNDVNVHKDTLRLEVDEQNPDHHLVSFVFDAMYDGSITILYFAKEEPDCKFNPLYPEAFMPMRIPFQKGSGQRFRQPSGTGIDLGFFELDDLSKASPEEDVFPLVISAETCPLPYSVGEHLNILQDASKNMQITQAVLEKKNRESFQVKVIRQLLWVDGVRYELRDIYGIGSSSVEGVKDDDSGKECVICMTEPKDTFVLPCRHMCMCSECAKELRLQSNKCPICRQPIEELVGIKINDGDE